MLTRGHLVMRLLRFGAPLAFAMAFHGLFNCIDLLIVGRLGPGAVASVTIGGIVNMVAMLAFNGVANVIGGKASWAAGTQNFDEFGRVYSSGFFLTGCMSIGLGGVFALLTPYLIGSFAADPQTAQSSSAYLLILSLGSGTMFFMLFQCAILRGLGKSLAPMIALIGANVINLLLDVILVFGLWGFPKLGVEGAAWATVFSRLLGVVYLQVVMGRLKKQWPLLPKKRSLVLRFLNQGCVHSLQMVIRVVSIYYILVIASGSLGSTHSEHRGQSVRDFLDGVGIGIRLEMVILFCCLGWGTGAASFLGQNMAAGLGRRAFRGVLVSTALALGSALSLGILLYCSAPEILGFVAPKATGDSLRYGVSYLQTVILGHPGLICAIVISQALVGISSVWTAVILDAVLYLGLLLPLASWLVSKNHEVGDIWALIVGIHLISAPLYLFFFGKRILEEKQKDAPNHAPAT